jgi:prefoldin subunit 5
MEKIQAATDVLRAEIAELTAQLADLQNHDADTRARLTALEKLITAKPKIAATRAAETP